MVFTSIRRPAPPARSAAWDVLRFFRDVTASLADDLTVFGGLIHAPDGSGMKLVALVVCHCGPLGAGETAAQPIKKFGSPAMDVIGPMPYCQVNAMLDAAYPKGALNYWKSNFLASLSDDALRTMIDCTLRSARQRWVSCCSSTSMARSLESASRTPHFHTVHRATTCSCCRNGWTRRTTTPAPPGLGIPTKRCSRSWAPAGT